MDHLSKTELDYFRGCELGTENLKVRECLQRNMTLGLIRFIHRTFHVPNVIHKFRYVMINLTLSRKRFVFYNQSILDYNTNKKLKYSTVPTRR